MRSARLTLALESGALTLPATGQIAVYRPRIGDDLSGLPNGQRGGADRVQARTTTISPHGLSRWPRTAPMRPRAGLPAPLARGGACPDRRRRRQRWRRAAGDRVDGQKTDGIDAMLKDCARRVRPVARRLSKAHGKLASCRPGRICRLGGADRDGRGRFQSPCPACFRPMGRTAGRSCWRRRCRAKLPAQVVDLGAGWGYLARGDPGTRRRASGWTWSRPRRTHWTARAST